ncbi:MAG TPA: hypothetical protein VER55_14345, partial [Ardenticatenaceae bacterium]|nr:hypothetical protein [Ardenticatenaceae bacterium]
MQAAYGRLARLDRYEFISRAEQSTHPLPTFENIGLGSETNSVLVEGLVDQRADRVELGITEQDGYLLDGMRQVEFRIEEGQISSRRPGQEWEVLDPEHALDAATTDPVAFLKAARHAQAREPEQRLGRTFQVIAFELDGRAWAELMRQQLQQEMARRGELAPGMVLQHLPYYEEMTGTGTLWINEQGLPQRLTTHVVYPPLPEESEYREVRMTTDFSDWQGGDLRAHLLNRLDRLSRSASGEAASLLPAAFLLSLFLVFPLGLVRYRQHKGLYQTTIVFLVTLFVGEPLLQASPVLAASTRRAEQQAASARTQAESDKVEAAIAGIQAEWTSSFDVSQGARGAAQGTPTLSALSVPAQAGAPTQAVEDPGGDPDQDGLDNRSEAALGLDLNDADSDGDKLSDGFEAAGIEVARKSWYLDPRNADTNGDEIPDTLECAQAVDIDDRGARDSSIAPTSAGCPDTDRDGTPDFADDDDDGDSVKDWMDSQRTARFGTAEAPVPQQTFTYGVEHYKANTPLRVTFELRPSNPQHLWYTLNVLDWPSGDYQGQITRVHDTTLGETEQQKNGDMQLVPVVEITLPAAEAGHLPTLPGAQPVVGGNDPDQLDNWLDMEVLQRYQMMVQWSPDNRSLLIYVPATLIRDRQGNAPANFVANVLYRPRGAGLFDPTNGNAGNHAARLVWMVMMSVDECTPPAPERDRSVCNPASSLYDEGRHWITTPKKL